MFKQKNHTFCFFLGSVGQFFKLGGMPPNLFLSCDFFLLSFFLSHNLLLFPHAWSDFNQTWSEWPVGEWLQKLSTVWPQRSCRGHRGQKGHFYGKCYSSYMFHWILTKLGQNNQRACGYKNYQVTGVKNVNHVKNMKTAPIQNLMVSSCGQQLKL